MSMQQMACAWLRRTLGAAAAVGLMVGGFLVTDSTKKAEAAPPDLENTLYMELPGGRVVIAMRPDLAPKHVARIKELTREGFYDGLAFHRVIPGFMAQGGDPSGNGSGGSGKKIKAEFSKEKHVRGTVSMARTQDPNSADSQFFICFDAVPYLDGKYTVWGQVIAGMEFVDQIKKGSEANNGEVRNPTKIVSMKVAADVERAKSLQ
jgi:peptidylprolyl isomerase